MVLQWMYDVLVISVQKRENFLGEIIWKARTCTHIPYALYQVYMLCSIRKKNIKLGESVTHGLSHEEVIVILSFVQEIYNKYLVVFFLKFEKEILTTIGQWFCQK